VYSFFKYQCYHQFATHLQKKTGVGRTSFWNHQTIPTFIREGFDHILTKKGIKAASADFGLIAIAYPSTKCSGQVIKKVTKYKRKPSKHSLEA
jgi:hypothetical protein